jgi:hypothetical protein
VACLERPVYSAGQLLTADALRLGQRYLDERFALRRYVDGVGVVCGLHVRCDPERPGWIVVEPGYAVDCRGRDIVLCEPARMDLCAAIARCPRPPDPCGGMAADAPSRDERIPAASTDEEQVLAYGADVKVRPREDRTCTYVLRAEPGGRGASRCPWSPAPGRATPRRSAARPARAPCCGCAWSRWTTARPARGAPSARRSSASGAAT